MQWFNRFLFNFLNLMCTFCVLHTYETFCSHLTTYYMPQTGIWRYTSRVFMVSKETMQAMVQVFMKVWEHSIFTAKTYCFFPKTSCKCLRLKICFHKTLQLCLPFLKHHGLQKVKARWTWWVEVDLRYLLITSWCLIFQNQHVYALYILVVWSKPTFRHKLFRKKV